ncbi:hypothetical protein ADIARSV_2712 [Arcticibacter svalbardensis MN12-7]|uniref:Uncharacterized protein n=1 Tax=Arcticibacter svalbardensis MN12-7 TaxID=1150600 RepID=R9GYQ4_9SPHI|nr:hypothetical protein ADIARSV_2712 [Arcticibacter svalbardensis MN12-7]
MFISGRFEKSNLLKSNTFQNKISNKTAGLFDTDVKLFTAKITFKSS